MRNLFAPVALVAGLALGSAAFAATPAPAPAAKPAATAAKAAPTRTAASKQQSCAASWKAQKTHTGTRAAFMKACVSKG